MTPAQAGRKRRSCSPRGEWASASRRQRGPVCPCPSAQAAARPDLGKTRPRTHRLLTISGLTVAQDARQSVRGCSKAAARGRSLPGRDLGTPGLPRPRTTCATRFHRATTTLRLKGTGDTGAGDGALRLRLRGGSASLEEVA